MASVRIWKYFWNRRRRQAAYQSSGQQKRCHEMRIRLTRREYQKIKGLAKDAGKQPSVYLRELALGKIAEQKMSRQALKGWMTLGIIGADLMQLKQFIFEDSHLLSALGDKIDEAIACIKDLRGKLE